MTLCAGHPNSPMPITSTFTVHIPCSCNDSLDSGCNASASTSYLEALIIVFYFFSMGSCCGRQADYVHSSEHDLETEEEPQPVEFVSIADTLETGDLCLLYRKGLDQPHYAMFVVYEDLVDHPPLLLLKGKTKPLSLSDFDSDHRHVRIVSANTRIFYGDYEKVTVCKLKKDTIIPGINVDKAADVVEETDYINDELDVIKNPNLSETSRSQHVCTFMLAHIMSQLGYLTVKPHTVRPDNFLNHLVIGDPISIKLPETRKGPLCTGSPPFLATLM